MKEFDITIHVRCYTKEELSAEDSALVDKAIAATQNSSALRLADGRIFIGANQENAAFPSGLCAERTAIFAAQANAPEQPILTLAIAARNDHGLTSRPISPCGACRQVVLEIEDRYQQPVRILLYGTDGIYEVQSVKDLLPFSFVDSCMKEA